MRGTWREKISTHFKWENSSLKIPSAEQQLYFAAFPHSFSTPHHTGMLYQIVRVFVSCLYTVFKWFPEQYHYYSITLWICSPLLPEHRSAWSESNAVTWCISSRWSIWRGKGFPRSGKRLHWRNRAGCIFCPSSLLLHLPHGSSSSRAAAESYFLPLHAG